MDEQQKTDEVLARLDRVENSLRQVRGLLWAIGALFVLTLVMYTPIPRLLFVVALSGMAALAVVYAFYWLLAGTAKWRARPRSDQELRAAILAERPPSPPAE